MQSFTIKNSLARFVKIHQKNSHTAPKELFSVEPCVPNLSGIKCPLPSAKADYTCFAKTANALWLGAPNGLTRYEENAVYEEDTVMFFTSTRELADSCVNAIYAVDTENGEEVWVLTETAVSHIILAKISAEEKAEILTDETLTYVSRHGMVSQKQLSVERELSSCVSYGHSDNSGTFTASFAMGELFRYGLYKRELGENHPKTVMARKNALKTTEACLLLMYLPGRGDGFVARTYVTPNEPVPDDGLFFRKENGKATCLTTNASIRRGIAGKVIDASYPVPERLKKLYTDEGFADDGIVYKGDTSSDEITHHFALIYFAHKILGNEDKELDSLLITAAKNTLGHILDHGNELCECDNNPTTWAKWSERYFATPVGWSDACLNAAELLMYLKVVMAVSGEKGRWLEAYNSLINEHGYAKLTTLHDSRFFVSALMNGMEPCEDLMYGDNSLATFTYWLLIELEDNKELKKMYQDGYRSWNGTFRREHNPAYDFAYMLSCPEDEINICKLQEWFRRQTVSRLAGSAGATRRKDVPERIRFGGTSETSWLLPPDELFISKYDRNPYDYKDTQDDDGLMVVESAYVYTFAYWLGRYFGFITEEKTND